jgi:hypothetical protein
MGTGFVRVFRMVSQNTHGGWDSDGVRYSSGGQFRSYEIATCPDNLLTLYGTDMMAGLTEADKRALRPVLEEIAAEVPDARSLTVWDRYRIAARFYRALGRDHLFIARLYAKGVWTVRDHAVGFFQGLEGPLGSTRRPTPPTSACCCSTSPGWPIGEGISISATTGWSNSAHDPT